MKAIRLIALGIMVIMLVSAFVACDKDTSTGVNNENSAVNYVPYSYPLDTLPEPVAAIDSYNDGKFVANGNRFA